MPLLPQSLTAPGKSEAVVIPRPAVASSDTSEQINITGSGKGAGRPDSPGSRLGLNSCGPPGLFRSRPHTSQTLRRMRHPRSAKLSGVRKAGCDIRVVTSRLNGRSEFRDEPLAPRDRRYSKASICASPEGALGRRGGFCPPVLHGQKAGAQRAPLHAPGLAEDKQFSY